MKKKTSLPSDKTFFSDYIWLVRTLNIAGYGGQAVSALTEIGGIYVAAFISLSPILPAWAAVYVSAAIAVLGTAIIEIGLRHSIPHCVDSILYGRFSGLRLAITIFVWSLSLVLLAASGLLSFKNSTSIVSNMTEGEKTKAYAVADSIKDASLITLDSLYNEELSALDSVYAQIVSTQNSALEMQVKSAEQNLKNWKNRQWRDKENYGTQIDAARLALSESEAALAAASAEISREKAEKADALKHDFQEKRKTTHAEYEKAIAEARSGQAEKVSQYGGGLAYFTIICLLILITSITINQIVKKGSGIKEDVEISQYDLLPHWIKAGYSAISHRFNYLVMSAITRFDEKTPDLDLPGSVREVYDPSEVTAQKARLKIEEGEESEYTLQRRRIKPFGKSDSDNQKNEDTPQFSYYEVNKRLRQYQKRLSSLRQKAASIEKKGGTVPARTTSAINNNAEWVQHWKAYKQRHYGE